MPSGGNCDYEDLWASLPEKALHPVREPMIEAFWRIGEPLSAIALVDVLDGFLSMWEAAHHLRVLEKLDVVERAANAAAKGRRRRDDLFDVAYRLKSRWESGS